MSNDLIDMMNESINYEKNIEEKSVNKKVNDFALSLDSLSQKEAKELISKLYSDAEYHSDLYYNKNKTEVSDYEYDIIIHKLKALENKFPKLKRKDTITERVGGIPASSFEKVTHEVPMQSLEDVFSYDEIRAFDKRVKKELGVNTDINYVVETKIDGLSASISYDNGKYVKGATRGNGLVGEDVTNNLRVVNGVLSDIDYKGKFILRGEVFMPKDIFMDINKKETELSEKEGREAKLLANPRNAAAGSLRQKNINIVNDRKLSIFVFNVQMSDKSFETHSDSLDFARDLGFNVNGYVKPALGIDEAIARVKEIGEMRADLDYVIDGAVIKVDNLKYRDRLGVTSKYPKWAVAFKYPPEKVKTKLTKVGLQVGRTGVVTPVAIFEEPKLVDGSFVSKASLHNVDIMRKKDIKINDYVLIQKAGDVIPEVFESLTDLRTGDEIDFVMPDNCPECNSELFVKNGIYKCLNIDCPARIYRSFIHFVSKSAMNIDGLGERIVEKLLDLKKVELLSDIYNLTIDDFIDVRKAIMDESSKRAIDDSESTLVWEQNKLDAIKDSKKRPPQNLLAGLGIDGLGLNSSKKLIEEFKSIDNIMKASIEDIVKVQDIGNITAENIYKFFNIDKNIKLMENFKNHGINFDYTEDKKELVSNIFKGKSFVVTGKFSKPRGIIQKTITENGGEVKSSVSKNTDFVLVGEDAGSKKDKAEKLQIPIIDEDNFNMILDGKKSLDE